MRRHASGCAAVSGDLIHGVREVRVVEDAKRYFGQWDMCDPRLEARR
jgi:hypothetical protein